MINKKIRPSFERRMFLVMSSFTQKQKIVFLLLITLLTISVFGLLWKVNSTFMIKVPVKGGSLTEGIVGIPRFVNPLFVISDADRDVTSLIYSGLLRATKNGKLIPDLAKSYEVSDNGLNYRFILKDNLVWQDGNPITVDDIIFTIQKTQDPSLRSVKRANWDGVTVEKINDKEILFTLERPYTPFLENTTMGILPKHIWKDVSTEQFGFSVKPIGSGPYKVVAIKKDSEEIPKYYDLTPFKKYALGEPYISKLRIRFYSNTEDLLTAFNNNQIESINSISPKSAKELSSKGYRVENTTFPRVFGVFFNQNQAKIFTNKTVRKALNVAINKKDIINKVLYGYATVINSPIPPGALGYEGVVNNDEFSSPKERISYAKGLLEANGWKFDEEKKVMTKEIKKKKTELAFSISTSEVPELKAVAEILKKQWEKIGARVTVKIFEEGSLKQNVIRPRKYDSLLFGEIIGRDSDLFAFWHSSQRLDPGLNIALYANITVDKLLEDAREITSTKERIKKYKLFQEEIKNDIPAVFLYSPNFIYVLPKKIKGVELQSATTPSERFLSITDWYIETDNVWKIFVKNNQ